ncbi:hypothetical protein TCON_2465 [Astathelohania contejeani]|uniref:Uncharacterized protein n=1 Tax=Astathelohania contejeani TaxID=164912 RepID=A0ABQ7HVX5_9MICR|nr:hypothetical protein TCON_2465 [Thelohania contejeani]
MTSKMKNMELVTVLIFLLVTITKNTTSCIDAQNIIPWAPLYIRKPYITFVDDPFHPTWQTRHQQSKAQIVQGEVLIPTVHNISFILTCGVCYKYFYRLQAQVTINVTIKNGNDVGESLSYEIFPGQFKYYIGCKIYECVITKVRITIHKSSVKAGNIICHLNRNKQHIQEIQPFRGIKKVKIYDIDNNMCALPPNLTLDSVIKSPGLIEKEHVCYIYPIVVVSTSQREAQPLLVYKINYTHTHSLSNHISSQAGYIIIFLLLALN